MVKKLLFLATYFPEKRDSARGNWALEQALAFVETGIDVKVVVPTPWIPGIACKLHPKLKKQADVPQSASWDGLTVHYMRWPCYPWSTFQAINNIFPSGIISTGWIFLRSRLLRLVSNYNPDAILAHHTLVSGQLANRISKLTGIPYVVTDHEVGDFISCEKNPAIHRIFSRVGSGARKMVVVSNEMKRLANRALPGIEFEVIHNGSSFEIFTDRQYGTPEEPLIFCCSKFYGRKDIPLLLRAFDAVVSRGIRARLIVAGDGPDLERIKNCLEQLENSSSVELLGLLPRDTVKHYMRTADIFALVGWAEPFGVVFLEAMAAGLPIIVSSDAGVAEVLEDGRDAVFSQPQDQKSVEMALEKLVKNPELRKKIGLAGQILLKSRFTWETVNKKYLEIFTPVNTE